MRALYSMSEPTTYRLRTPMQCINLTLLLVVLLCCIIAPICAYPRYAGMGASSGLSPTYTLQGNTHHTQHGLQQQGLLPMKHMALTSAQNSPAPSVSNRFRHSLSMQQAADIGSYSVTKLSIFDLGSILWISVPQFLPQCKTIKSKIELIFYIVYLFAPKLLWEDTWGHTVIGVKEDTSKRLMGVVDLSLQTCTGAMDALNVMTFQSRISVFGAKNLRPYLCNLLVGAQYRRRGLGRVLVRECQQLAACWGFTDIYLHVESDDFAALSLYLSEGYSAEKGRFNGGRVLFLHKNFRSIPNKPLSKQATTRQY